VDVCHTQLAWCAARPALRSLVDQGYDPIPNARDPLDLQLDVGPLAAPVVERVEQPLVAAIAAPVGQLSRLYDLDVGVGGVEDVREVPSGERSVGSLHQLHVLLRNTRSPQPQSRPFHRSV
jgi:hypothetical protein